jgi:hypothetical protein
MVTPSSQEAAAQPGSKTHLRRTALLFLCLAFMLAWAGASELLTRLECT